MITRLWRAGATTLKSKQFMVNGFKLDQNAKYQVFEWFEILKYIIIPKSFTTNWAILARKLLKPKSRLMECVREIRTRSLCSL